MCGCSIAAFPIVGILSNILFRGILRKRRDPGPGFRGQKRSPGRRGSSGHLFAKRTAAASLTLPAYREEQWNGRSQLKFIHALTESWDETLEDFINRIGDLKAMIVRKDGLLANLTADGQGLRLLSEAIEPVMARMSESPSAVCDVPVPVLPSRMGVVIPAQVSYVAEAFPAPTYGSPLAAPLFVLSRLLSNGCLYQKIRVQGGAYGECASTIPQTACCLLLPGSHLERTLAVYGLRFAEDGNSAENTESRHRLHRCPGPADGPPDGFHLDDHRRVDEGKAAIPPGRQPGNRELTEGL